MMVSCKHHLQTSQIDGVRLLRESIEMEQGARDNDLILIMDLGAFSGLDFRWTWIKPNVNDI